MKRMNENCKLILYFMVLLGGLFSGTASAAIAINDSYSFNTADTVPFQVFVIDNDDVDIDFNAVTLTLGQLFTDNATFRVVLQSEGNPYFEVTPDASFTTGTIEFNYTVTDPAGSSDAFVSIEVTNTGLDKLVDDTYFANVDVPVTFNVLDNDTITASEFNAAADTSGLTGGSLVSNPAIGSYTFTGTSAGESVFTYTVDSVAGQTATVTVFVDSASIPKSTISASTSGGATVSEGATAQITLARSGSAQEAISIQVALKLGSTADASDFTLSQSTVSWAVGDTASKTVTVSVNKDTAIEAAESLVFEFINPTGGAEYIGADIALTISATDSVNFVSANYSVLEDAGSVNIEVSRSGTGSGAASINLFLDAGSTATVDSDFTFTDGTTVSWIDGETGNKTVTIPIIFDADALEGTENIVLNLASNANLIPGSVFSTSIAIANVVSLDDVSFVSTTYSVAENAGSVTVQVQRVGNGVGAAAVDVELAAPETATQGSDFTFATTATVNWLDGETGTKDIVIPIVSDASVEGDETFSLQLASSPINALRGTNTATQVTITDALQVDDVSFVSATYSTAENAGSVTVQVQRVGSGTGAAAVDVELAAAETATQGTDFTFATTTVNWLAGETGTKGIVIPIASDLSVEGNETFSLSLGAIPTNAKLGANTATQVTIADVVPIDDVGFVSTTYFGAENGSVTVQVQRVGSGVGAAAVDVELAAAETATQGTDFTFATTMVNWLDGETGTKSIVIPIASDVSVEGEETFSLSLGTSPTNANLGANTVTQVTIADVIPIDDVSFVSTTYSVAEDAASVTVQVQRVGSGIFAAAVDVELAAAETATQGADFTFATTTVNWLDGETGTKDIVIPIAFDASIEGDETFTLSLGTSPANANLGTNTATQVTITNVIPIDDVSFVGATYSVAENAGSVTVQVQRVGSGIFAAALDVELAAAETATQGTDFTFATTVTINWLDGETGTKDIVIPIATDQSIEGNETFTLSIGTSPTNVNLGTNTSTKVTIIDVVLIDDVGFVSTTYSVTEGAGAISVQVQRIGGGLDAASVTVALAPAESALEGTDFIFGGAVTVSWIEGEIGIKDINIPIVADTTVEENETFTLSLSNPISINLGSNTSTQITIADSGTTELDSVGFANATYRAAESTGFIDIGLLRTGAGVGLVEVNVSYVLLADELGVAISPANESDFSLPSDAVVKWLDGEVGIKTLTINISPDSPSDANGDLDGEFFSLVLDPNSLVGDVQIKETADDASVVIFAKELLGDIVADDSPVKEVADAVDAVCANVDDNDTSALTECEKLSELSESEIEQTLEIIKPKTVEAQIKSAVELAGNQLQNMRKRMSEIRGGRNQVSLAGLNMSLFDENVPLPAAMQSMLDTSVGGAAGAEGGLLDSPWGAFINGTLSVGEQDDDDGSLGYSIRSKGITAGIDYRINRKVVIGTAIGFGSSDSDFNQNSGGQESSSITLTVFGNHFINSKIYADWIVSYTKNEFDIKRKLDVLGTIHNISASPDGNQYSIAVGGGYDYVRGALQLTGFGRIDYINTTIDSYEETGSFYALALTEQNSESLATAFGVKSAYVISTKKAVYIPSLELEWVHEYNEDARTIEAAFAQSPSAGSFSIETEASDTDHLNAAFSISAMFSGGKSAFFRYDTLLGEDDRTSESYTLGGRYEF